MGDVVSHKEKLNFVVHEGNLWGIFLIRPIKIVCVIQSTQENQVVWL